MPSATPADLLAKPISELFIRWIEVAVQIPLVETAESIESRSVGLRWIVTDLVVSPCCGFIPNSIPVENI